MNLNSSKKPGLTKNYGSIPHLIGSRLGPGDHTISKGQSDILTVSTRDKHDKIFVHEKLDGSNVGIIKVDGVLYAISRSGRLCSGSILEQHQLFAEYVRNNYEVFDFLQEGERIVGEWLAQAHGTRYKLNHEPFVVFDLMKDTVRATQEELESRLPEKIIRPKLLHSGSAISIKDIDEILGKYGHHGAIDPAEGAVYRVERFGKVDFLAKYVRDGKQDGTFMKMEPPIWNWHPRKAIVEP